jgi:hypothetical protein
MAQLTPEEVSKIEEEERIRAKARLKYSQPQQIAKTKTIKKLKELAKNIILIGWLCFITLILIIGAVAYFKSAPNKPSVTVPVATNTKPQASPVVSSASASNTANNDQQTLENNIKGIISNFKGGNTKVSYGELRIMGSDETDVPAGTKALLIDVVIDGFSDKNYLIQNTANPLTFQLMQAAFTAKAVNAYFVNVFYTVNIPLGNQKDTEVLNYSIIKDTYNKMVQVKIGSNDLCNFLNEQDKESSSDVNYLGGDGCIDK